MVFLKVLLCLIIDINYLSLTKNRSLLWLPEVNVYDGHNVFLTQQNEDVKIGVYFNGIVSYNMR